MKQFEQYQDLTISKSRRMVRYFTEIINRRVLVDSTAITYEQFPLLIITLNFEGCSMQEIARITNQDKAGILRGLRALQTRGLIKFKNDPMDQRKRLVFSTLKAKNLSSKIMRDVRAFEKELFHEIPEEEVIAFLCVMKKLTDKFIDLGATKLQRYKLKKA